VVAEWNLARLAEAMLPLIDDDQEAAVATAVESLGRFRSAYSGAWSAGMSAKLGLPRGLDEEVTSTLVKDLLEIMQSSHVDHSCFFRNLGAAARGDRGPARDLCIDVAAFDAWADRWLALEPDAALMDSTNPVYIPRNHRVEEALDAANEGDVGPTERLLEAVTRPFDERPGLERYAAPPPADFGKYVTYCGT